MFLYNHANGKFFVVLFALDHAGKKDDHALVARTVPCRMTSADGSVLAVMFRAVPAAVSARAEAPPHVADPSGFTRTNIPAFFEKKQKIINCFVFDRKGYGAVTFFLFYQAMQGRPLLK